MQIEKKFHPNNLHNKAYDFNALIKKHKPLKPFVKPNKYGNLSIDFFDEKAVRILNQALLSYFYDIEYWDIPKGYLCPPIPGRVDYIHYLNDLLKKSMGSKNKGVSNIKAMDVGVGANGVYSLLANKVYNWKMLGSDIDKVSIENMQKIIGQNSLQDIELRLQNNPKDIFKNIIKPHERFHCTLCNPPFHSSKKEAQKGSKRKVQNLTKQKVKEAKLNFGGQSNELWCKGGELQFIHTMIEQSKLYADNVLWFTSLVSKKEHLKAIESMLHKIKAKKVHIIPMHQGQKITRFIAWSFLSADEQHDWIEQNS